MWKRLDSFGAQTRQILNILTMKAAHIQCAAVDLAFLRKHYLVLGYRIPMRIKDNGCVA